jgi:hypothetical protein
MTTRNFRVNNGLSVGDIVIDASANTIVGLATAAPSADGDVSNKKYVDDQDAAIASDTLTFTNKTIDANGTGNSISNIEVADFAAASIVLESEGIASNDNDTTLPTSAAVLDYVTTALGALSSNSISQLDTNITVTDSGSNGTIVMSADGNTELTITDAGVRVHGNLTVDGTETIINTATLSVEDNIIEVNRNVSSNAGMPSISGMKVNRGEGSSATEQDLFWAWDETFADDGSTIYGNAGGAWTAFKRAQGDSSTPGTADLADIRANVVHALSTSAQYADVAERFEADAPMTAGAVVEVAGTAEITESTTDLSENVFGVISDMPAYAMNAGAGNNDTHPFVAMTGRTPVRVTGAVTKGQRLVTSSVKGCARAVAVGESITPFNVIGRALESSTDAGIKLVNCAVRTNN